MSGPRVPRTRTCSRHQQAEAGRHAREHERQRAGGTARDPEQMGGDVGGEHASRIGSPRQRWVGARSPDGVGARRFHRDDVDLAKAAQPVQQLPVTGRRGRKALRAEQNAALIKRRGVMSVSVRAPSSRRSSGGGGDGSVRSRRTERRRRRRDFDLIGMGLFSLAGLTLIALAAIVLLAG
jgi:hypothetical protein